MGIFSVIGNAGDDPTTHPNPLPLSTIRPDHPRLWFNSDNVNLLRERWTDPIFGDIVSKYEGHNDAISLALEGLATEDTAKCSLAAEIVGHDYSPLGGGPDAGYFDEISYVFDWCYEYLDYSTKIDLISKVRSLRYQHKNNSSTGLRSFFRWHETFLKSSFAYLASVLAIEGEPGVGSELREAQNVLQNLQELGDEVSGDGGYRDYFFQGSFQVLPFLMWSSATDMDFAARSSFTRNFTKWATYKLSPTGRGFLRGPGDDYAFESAYTRSKLAAGAFYALASHFSDPVAQWLGNHLEREFTQIRDWPSQGPSFLSLVLYDPAKPVEEPSQAGFPRTVFFEKSGMVHTRSSWKIGPEVIHSWFYNGPATEHSGESQNHFTIWRGDDPLIMQGGGYLGSPSTYQSHYYQPTISDNSVLFSSIGSDNPDHDGGQSSSYSDSDLNAGYYPVAERVGSFSGQHRYRGSIIHFEDGGSYAIVSGDATAAYNPEHVHMYVRDFVYLKPDIFLIRDRFETAGVASIRSLIHSRARPIYDSVETVIQGSTDSGIFETSGVNFRIQNGSSEADIEVLWPLTPTLRFVGGAGYEGYADGYNSDPWTDCQDWLRNHWELPERIKLIEGQWRTEIETTPQDSNGSLIYAVFVSEKDPISRARFSVQRDGEDLVVNVTHDQSSKIIVFSEDDAPRVYAARVNASGRRLAPHVAPLGNIQKRGSRLTITSTPPRGR